MNTEVRPEEILAWIQESGINTEIGEEDFTTPLSDLGVDSLDFFSILEVLEAKSAISIPDDAANQLRSIQDLTDFINTRGAGI